MSVVDPSSASLSTETPSFTLPGSIISLSSPDPSISINLGKGLVPATNIPRPFFDPNLIAFQSNPSNPPPSNLVLINTAVATQCGYLSDSALLGRLSSSNPRLISLESNTLHYQAQIDDPILAIVSDKRMDGYRLILNGTSNQQGNSSFSQVGFLPSLSFQGASNKNKPNLAVGSLIYCRVVAPTSNTTSTLNPYSELELSCISPFSKLDWVTGQCPYREILGGYSFCCSPRYARILFEGLSPYKSRLLAYANQSNTDDSNSNLLSQLGNNSNSSPDSPVLFFLCKIMSFEMLIGLNGRLWINSSKIEQTLKIARCILQSEHQNIEKIKNMIETLIGIKLDSM
jgi:exosome complex component RRP40